MPGEKITIDPANYPELAKIEDGEQVELKVMGVKSTDEDGMIQIETSAIEQTNANPAKKGLKDLKKPSPAGGMMRKGGMMEDEVPAGDDY